MDASALSFDDLYTTFQPRIRHYLIHLVGETEAEDLAQEVFVKVYHALPNFRGDAKLCTWLYRIATNAALDRLRGSSSAETTQTDLWGEAAQTAGVECDDRDAWTGEKSPLLEQQLVRIEMSECMRGLVDKLPEDYRTVLVLSQVAGLRNREIADVVGISLPTVKIRLHRARERLKAEILAHCDSDWAEQNEYVPDLRRLGSSEKSIATGSTDHTFSVDTTRSPMVD